MATSLITLEEAKRHLKITHDAFDEDIESKAEQATAKVLEICNSTAYWRAITATWITSEDVPLTVKAAIFQTLAHMFMNRGDDPSKDESFYRSIDRALAYKRDPVIA